MIGYAPQARAVTVAGGQPVDVDVALTAQAVNLAEMVVVGLRRAAAGQHHRCRDQRDVRASSTPAASSRRPSSSRTRSPGVQVVENNEPGGRTSIRIRGPTSTSASNEPLYVIDGLPMGTAPVAGSPPGATRSTSSTPTTSRASRCCATPALRRSTAPTPPTAWC